MIEYSAFVMCARKASALIDLLHHTPLAPPDRVRELWRAVVAADDDAPAPPLPAQLHALVWGHLLLGEVSNAPLFCVAPLA